VAAPECDEFGEDLSAYLDGELPQQRAAELEQHLLGCDSCRGTFEQLRNVAERLAELPHVRAPDELTAAMRRAAERQVLLEVRTPRAETRVWKLFARVSASAALIAACMFAGWQVYERMQEPSVPLTEHRLAEAAKGEPLSKESIGRGMRSLDVAQAKPVEQPTGAVKPAAPALARADKTKGVEAEVPTEAYPDVSAREHLAAVESDFQLGLTDVPVAATTAATIDVFVTPQDPQQAMAVRGTLAAWQKPVGIELDAGKRGSVERYAGGAPAARVPVVRAGRAGVAETVDRREFAFELTAAEANELIEQLEQQAPRQVLLRYADMQRVQQAAERDELDRLAERGLADELGRPAAAPAADAEEEGQPGALGLFGAGAGARRVAPAEKLRPRSPAGKQEEMGERRGRGRGGERRAPAKAAKKDEKAATAQRGVAARMPAAPAALEGRRLGAAAGEDKGKRAPERAAEVIAAPASQPLAAGEQPATLPTQAEQWRATVAQVRDQLGELLLGTFMRAAAEAAPPPSEPPPSQPVTVRVMLLPLPQAEPAEPATRPTRKSSSAE